MKALFILVLISFFSAVTVQQNLAAKWDSIPTEKVVETQKLCDKIEQLKIGDTVKVAENIFDPQKPYTVTKITRGWKSTEVTVQDSRKNEIILSTYPTCALRWVGKENGLQFP